MIEINFNDKIFEIDYDMISGGGHGFYYNDLRIAKYFFTKLTRHITMEESAMIFDTYFDERFDLSLIEIMMDKLDDKKFFILSILAKWDKKNRYMYYRQNIDEVIKVLDFLFNKKFNIDLGMINGPEFDDTEHHKELDIRIIKWFKNHEFDLNKIINDAFINRSKDDIIWILENVNINIDYGAVDDDFRLTYEELVDLIEKKILPLPEFDDLELILSMYDHQNKIEIFERIKDRYYPNK